MVFIIPAQAADCVDSDGDGYVATCAGCDLPSGKMCGDCNDGDGSVHPGHPEICGDGKDNDCVAGGILEPGSPCPVGDPSYCPSSITVCSGDLLSLVCPEPHGGYDVPSPEAWTDPASCTDEADNDCDGLTDQADCGSIAEKCDGYDNNYNSAVDEGFNVNDSCTAGIGECLRTGALHCSDDGTTSVCSAIAGSPKDEVSGIGNRCSDGLDNDCDGVVDGDDPGCNIPIASFELCDGIDNDLDGEIDEIYPGLGDPCSAGIGPCQASGTVVCTANKLATECSAVASVPGVEGPSGNATCSDGTDNDCDGLIDTNGYGAFNPDPDCNAAGVNLAVNCALPYVNGKPGSDCTGKHTIKFGVSGGVSPVVQAELLALDADGQIIDLIPNVKKGQTVHMASRLDPSDYKLTSKKNNQGRWYEVFAPIPVLHVTAQEGDAKVEAFCSNIPYLDVVKPDGQVVSISSGDTVDVTVALPRVSPTSLSVMVDGMNILPAMGIDPMTAFPGGPYDGSYLNSDGETVEVTHLTVDTAGGIDDPAANTLTMTLKNLGGGGHIIYVAGDPLTPPRRKLTAECLQDDLADAGTVSALGVTINTPEEQSNVSAPILAEGVIEHGREIGCLKLNGMQVTIPPLGTGGYSLTPGDGMTAADQYVFNFSTYLDQATITELIAGTAPAGTVERGSNKLVADACDDLGNRAFDTQMFAVGDTLSPTQAAAIVSPLESKLQEAVQTAKLQTMNALSAPVENAFVAGMEESAVDKIFQNVCKAASDEFKSRIQSTINGTDLGSVTLEPDCSCNVTANFVLESVKLVGDPVCDAAFSDGKIDVSFQLPDVEIIITAKDSCKTTGLFGECFTKTVVDIWAKTYIDDPKFSFTITEDQIETNTPPPDTMKTFGYASMRYPGSNGESLENDSDVWSNDSGTHCWGAGVCTFFEGAAGFLINVFTFGIVEATDVFDFVNVKFDLADFQEIAGASEPDPVSIGDMSIDPQTVENYGRAKFTPTLDDIDISPLGLTASFSATFETQSTDPAAEENPGAALTPAQTPGLPQDPGNAFMAIADDTINQLFASMSTSGLSTTCTDTGKTVNDLLPAESDGGCESLTGETDAATALIQGICHGVRGADCETLTANGPLLQATEQGICHGVQGDVCTTIPADNPLVERAACNNAPRITLLPSDPLLFCSRQSIPPQFVINDVGGTDGLESNLLLNGLTVAIVVDRPANGLLDGTLETTANCFAADTSSQVDCSLYTACVNLTLNTTMDLKQAGETSECPNDPAFVFGVNLPVMTSGLQPGVICGGAATQTDDNDITASAAGDQTVEQISKNTAVFTPPLCAKGMDLGGLFNFNNPKLFSIEAGGPDSYGDYFGIIGTLE